MKKCTMVLILVGLLLVNVWSVSLVHPVSARPNSASVTLSGARVEWSTPAVADLNGDDYQEIVVGGSDGRLHVASYSGATWSEVWSHQTNDDINAANPPNPNPDNEIRSAPAIADLDDDGHPDIVVTVGSQPHAPMEDRRNGAVLVYRYEGDSPWSFSLIEPLSGDGTKGWPQPRTDEIGSGPGEGEPDGLWDSIETSPALGDLDGDGDLEIVVEGMDRRIHAWHHDGTVVQGWPISQWNGDELWRGGLSSPALGDLDGDGLPEVVVGTMSPYDSSDPNGSGTLWAIDGNSSSLPGFPIMTEQFLHSSPALGDIDGDGQLEIVIGVGNGVVDGRQNIVYAWNHDGTPLPNWPREAHHTVIAPPALGDIDGDGLPEVIIGTGGYDTSDNNQIYAWNADGSAVSGFPVRPPSPNPGLQASYSMYYSPILADLEGDGTVEIVINHFNDRGVVVVEADGTVGDYTSHTLPTGLLAPPVVADVDGDDLLEIVAACGDGSGNGLIQIWDESGSVASQLPWPMFHHDVTRTGLYVEPPALPELGFPDEVRLLHQTGSGDTARGSLQIWNRGQGQFDWQLDPSTSAIQLAPTGGTLTEETLVEITVDVGGLPAGWTTVGTVTATATFQGEEIVGSPQVATVYVYLGDLSYKYLPLILSGQ